MLGVYCFSYRFYTNFTKLYSPITIEYRLIDTINLSMGGVLLGKRYIVFFWAAVISFSILISGCMEISLVDDVGGDASILSGNLTLTGSTSMADVSNALSESFMIRYPNVTITVGGNGSGEGAISVRNGTAQIGLLSRSLKDAERPTDFDVNIIGYDGVVIIVHQDCPIDSISIHDLADIFSGKINSWSEFGGQETMIQRIGREAASGTRSAFEDILGIPDESQYEEEQNSTGNIKQSVASNPDAIGYISLSAVDDTVKVLAVEGVLPSEDTILSNEYKLIRPFLMITDISTNDRLTEEFLEFVYSEEGMSIISDDGIVPSKKL